MIFVILVPCIEQNLTDSCCFIRFYNIAICVYKAIAPDRITSAVNFCIGIPISTGSLFYCNRMNITDIVIPCRICSSGNPYICFSSSVRLYTSISIQSSKNKFIKVIAIV